MLGQPGKGEVRVVCDKPFLPEFPGLLYGIEANTQTPYIDATAYLNKTECKGTVQQFKSLYRYQINVLCGSYNIDADKAFVINGDGHILIESNLAYLFISFVEPHFLAHMCDRIHELFSYGVVVSDSYLLQKAQTRLSQEVLRQIIGDEQESN